MSMHCPEQLRSLTSSILMTLLRNQDIVCPTVTFITRVPIPAVLIGIQKQWSIAYKKVSGNSDRLTQNLVQNALQIPQLQHDFYLLQQIHRPPFSTQRKNLWYARAIARTSLSSRAEHKID
ncbi:hypothetical protein [Scytonema millei]|uniref:hypothetical protein n=1 Tax=Scytonema millei TaxID=1245922 RepID=UPI002852EE2C|nr:hypothetical protein [Scytonema millei]